MPPTPHVAEGHSCLFFSTHLSSEIAWQLAGRDLGCHRDGQELVAWKLQGQSLPVPMKLLLSLVPLVLGTDVRLIEENQVSSLD